MGPFGGASSGPFKIPISSDPKKKSKTRYNEKVRWFKITFWLFCFISLIISLRILILAAVKSADPQSYDLPESCPSEDAGGRRDLRNLYDVGFSFDFHAFLGGEHERNTDQEGQLIWQKRNLTYGDRQSIFSLSTNVFISEVGQPIMINKQIEKSKTETFLFSTFGAMAVFTCTSI